MSDSNYVIKGSFSDFLDYLIIGDRLQASLPEALNIISQFGMGSTELHSAAAREKLFPPPTQGFFTA